MHVGDLALAIESELDHRAPVLVRVELTGGIPLAGSVDHLLRPDAPDGLLHAVEEPGELEAARVEEGALSLFDAAEVVRHGPAGDGPRGADRLVQRQLERTQIAWHARLRARRPGTDAGRLSVAARIGLRDAIAGALERIGAFAVAHGPVRRLLQPKGIPSLPSGKLRHFALALLFGAAARRAVVARVRARRRSARFGLVGTPFLLQLRKRVLVEGARFAGARLLLDAAVLLGEILRRLVRRLLVGGPERNHLALLELLLFLGRRNRCDGQPRNLLLWRSSSRLRAAGADALQLRPVRGDQGDDLGDDVLGGVEDRVPRHAEHQQEVPRDRYDDRNGQAAAPPGRLLRQRHGPYIVAPARCGRRVAERRGVRRNTTLVGLPEHPS